MKTSANVFACETSLVCQKKSPREIESTITERSIMAAVDKTDEYTKHRLHYQRMCVIKLAGSSGQLNFVRNLFCKYMRTHTKLLQILQSQISLILPLKFLCNIFKCIQQIVLIKNHIYFLTI